MADLMALLLDTSIWIAFLRTSTSKSLKLRLAPYILDPAACLAEPVVFELLRRSNRRELPTITRHFATYPTLATPPDLWQSTAVLGRHCQSRSISAGSLDLLIAAIAVHHHATLVTFDADFELIATVSPLQVRLLQRLE